MMGLHKVRTLWRLAQRKTKDQELRQDIEIFSQTFTRVMDCKDSAIEVAAGLAGRGGMPGDTHDPPQKLHRRWSGSWKKRRSSRTEPCAATCTSRTNCCSSSAAAWATWRRGSVPRWAP